MYPDILSLAVWTWINKEARATGPEKILIIPLLKKAAQCTGCGECMTRSPYSLPIPGMIKENFAWVEEYKKGLNI
jgi:Fe-S oxidoreductase